MPSSFRSLTLAAVLAWRCCCVLCFLFVRRSQFPGCIQQLRGFLQQAGATWIKAGQLLSLRSDLFQAEVCRELASLRDSGYGIPFESVKQILEADLRRPLQSTFDHFEEQPFLATSVAQLHRAYLRNEKAWVVVKVQKPHVTHMFQQDMSLIRKIAWLLNALSVYPNMRWGVFCKQLDDLMTKELDFRYEASSLRRLKKTLRNHGVYVPETFSQYSSRQVLVMEFIHGALLADAITLQHTNPVRLHAWLDENHISPKRLARRLFESVYRQIFEDNLFHGDMHPGNIVLLRHNRLAILDCRSVGSLEGELLTKYRLFLHALAHQRYSHAADLYFLAATSLPVVDMSRVKTKLTRIWRVWEMKTHIRKFAYHEKSLGAMFDEMNSLVFRYQFTIQWGLSKMARALANLDASLHYLDPPMNYLKYMRRYFVHAERRTAQAKFQQTRRRLPGSINAAQALPIQVSEYMLFQQNILRRQAQVIQGKTTEAGYVIASVLGCLSLGLLFVEGLGLCAFVQQVFSSPLESIVGAQLVALFRELPEMDWNLWLLVLGAILLLFFGARYLKAQFEQEDVQLPGIQLGV